MLMHFFDDKMTRTRDYLGLQARKENSSFCMKKKSIISTFAPIRVI